MNGVQLDPVSFLLHGLCARFAPLDEEGRLKAAQDLLTFHKKPHETIDSLLSRFEIVRAKARVYFFSEYFARSGGFMLAEYFARSGGCMLAEYFAR